MTKRELREELDKLRVMSEGDPDAAHREADNLLLEYIDDVDITRLFKAVKKWYA